jgi:hypothetical protein
MATFYHHRRDMCGYEFDTSGPHEFYRDETGRLADYGHPLPKSLDAEWAGVYGFYGRMWCLRRGDESPVMGDSPRGAKIPCPKCGGTIANEATRWS